MNLQAFVKTIYLRFRRWAQLTTATRTKIISTVLFIFEHSRYYWRSIFIVLVYTECSSHIWCRHTDKNILIKPNEVMHLRKSKYRHTFVYEIVLTLYVILWQVFASLLMMKLSMHNNLDITVLICGNVSILFLQTPVSSLHRQSTQQYPSKSHKRLTFNCNNFWVSISQ
jgi:hypothetical protein